MRILVDVMSGDNAPLEIIKGAIDAANEYKEHEIMIVGDENVISDVVVKNELVLGDILIRHAPDVINMEDRALAVPRKARILDEYRT